MFLPYSFKKASEGVSIIVFIENTSANPGGGKTGIGYASMTAQYQRPGAAAAAISLSALASADAAWSAGGWFELGLGFYRLDLPNAALAAGVPFVVIALSAGVVTGARPWPTVISLLDSDSADLATAAADAALAKAAAVAAASDAAKCRKTLWNKRKYDRANGRKIIYEDDGETAARTFQITPASDGILEVPT